MAVVLLLSNLLAFYVGRAMSQCQEPAAPHKIIQPVDAERMQLRLQLQQANQQIE
jgi:hypothetical protein